MNMKIVSKAEFIEILKKAEKPIAYLSIDDRWDGVNIAPPGCFGSYNVRPYEEYIEMGREQSLSLDDTDFYTDYGDNDEFVIYDNEDILRMIKILSFAIDV